MHVLQRLKRYPRTFAVSLLVLLYETDVLGVMETAGLWNILIIWAFLTLYYFAAKWEGLIVAE